MSASSSLQPSEEEPAAVPAAGGEGAAAAEVLVPPPPAACDAHSAAVAAPVLDAETSTKFSTTSSSSSSGDEGPSPTAAAADAAPADAEPSSTSSTSSSASSKAEDDQQQQRQPHQQQQPQPTAHPVPSSSPPEVVLAAATTTNRSTSSPPLPGGGRRCSRQNIPTPHTKPWTTSSHCQAVHDALDTCSLVLTTTSLALAAVLCALCLQYPELAWVGLLLLGFTIAAPVAVGGIILARNHWLVVVLRYCLSVAALQRDSGLSFGGVRWRPLRAVLSCAMSGVLAVVGLVVAVYLSACYVVTAVLSVPLLDVTLLFSLLPPVRRRSLAADLVFLESYKPARAVVSAVLQALPLALFSALLLAASYSSPGTAAAAAAAGGEAGTGLGQPTPVMISPNGTVHTVRFVAVNSSSSSNSSSSEPVTRQGRRRVLSQQQQQQSAAAAAAAVSKPDVQQQATALKGSVARALLVDGPAAASGSSDGSSDGSSSSSRRGSSHSGGWDPRMTVSQALAALLGSSSGQSAAAAAAGGAAGQGTITTTSGSSSSSSTGMRQLPTVAILSTEGSSGQRVQVTLVLANKPPDSSSSSSSSSTSSSSIGPRGFRDLGGRAWLGFIRNANSSSSGSSSSGLFVMSAPSWGGLTASAGSLPVGLLVAAAAVGLADLLLVVLMAVLGARAAGVGFWRLGLTLRMRGGSKLPEEVTKEAMSQMVKDGGRRLLLTNVYHWEAHNSSSGSSKLPLVPRYLFPPDGGWLVPGQMCFLARRALALMQQQQQPHSRTAAAAAAVDTGDLAASTTDSSGGSSSSSSGGGGECACPSSISSSSSQIEVLEVEHCSCVDLQVLLGAAVGSGRLTGLHTLQLNWCCVGKRSLVPLLQTNSSSSSGVRLTHLNLRRCEVSDLGGVHLKTLLSDPACCLKTLAIVSCHMPPTASKAVAQGLGANSSLSSLRFSSNSGGKQAALAFATALRNNVTLQHLNLSFNKLCPSGGEALAAALSANARLAAAAAGSSGSSGSSGVGGLRRLVVQRKEIGGAGLKAVVAALRGVTGYTGGLTVRVLQAPGVDNGGSSQLRQGSAAAAAAASIRVLQVLELPVLIVCHESQEVLISEEWLTHLLDKQQPQQQQQQQQSSGDGGDLIPAGAAAAADVPCSSSSSTASSVTSSPARSVSSSAASSRPGSSGGHSVAASSSSNADHADHAVIEIEVLQEALQQQQQQQQQPTSSPSAAGSSSSSRGKPPRQPGRVSGFAAAAAAVEAAAPFKLSPGRGSAAASSSSSSLEPSVSGLTDGLTPACSMAEGCMLSSAASAAAAAAALCATTTTTTSSSSQRCCPQLIFLSQNDPGDNVAALLRSVEGVAAVDLSGLQLSSKGVKSLAAAVPEAKSLSHLVLRSTGLLDAGAAALAAALQQQPASPLLTPASCSSSSPVSPSPGSGSNRAAGSSTGGTNSSSSSSALQVLDLSQNIICDTGAEQIAAAVTAGVLPQLRQLAVVENRYPLDWSTVLQLQGLQVLQPGLHVDLGAPSSWCVAPAAVNKTRGSAAFSPPPQGGLAAAVLNPRRPDAFPPTPAHLPAGWTSSTAATAAAAGSDGGCDPADLTTAAADAGGAAATDALSVASEDLCGVCFDAPNALLVQGCGHELCIGCYRQLVKAAAAAAAASSRRHQQGSADGGPTGCAACPFCRAPMAGFKYSAWVQEEERQGGV